MRAFRVITAIFLLTVASVLLALLVSQFSGGYIASPILRDVTEIVTGSFGSLSLCIPFFLFWFFYICWSKNSTLLSLLWPSLSVIPFFTLTLGIKTLLYSSVGIAPPLWSSLEWMGHSSVITLWFFTTALSIFIITMLYSYGFKSEKPQQPERGSTLKNIYHSFFDENRNRSVARPVPVTRPVTTAPETSHEIPTCSPPPPSPRQRQAPYQASSHSLRYPGENTTLDHVVLMFNRNAQPSNTNFQRSKDLQEEAENDAIMEEFPLGADAFSYQSDAWDSEESRSEIASPLDENSSAPDPNPFFEDADSQYTNIAEYEKKNASLTNSPKPEPEPEPELAPELAPETEQDSYQKLETIALPQTEAPVPALEPYNIPVDGILDPAPLPSKNTVPIEDISRLLEETLAEFNIESRVTAVKVGPVVTRFEMLPSPGVRLRRIVELSDNIALRLAAPSIRIVAPIPGKQAVGVEVPNHSREIVPFSEMISQPLFSPASKHSTAKKRHILPIALGKDISDNVVIEDLTTAPHLLIAGATGSGKSVCVNAFICSLLYSLGPDKLKLLLIDPKIVELSFYNDIAHLLTPVITEPRLALTALKWCAEEMERRYRVLENHGAREIASFNLKMEKKGYESLPYMVIVIDEFADLMVSCGKELEILVSRIAAKSRAVGIHLIVATQRPSTDVITGLIKANIPSRIAFMVTSKTDSRIILDMNGAEKLLGKGDMLYSSSSDPYPLRIQGTYLSEYEVDKVVTHIKNIAGPPRYIDDEIFSEDDSAELGSDLFSSQEDPLWDEAVEEIKLSQKASASYLQRRFKIGYNRAARMVDEMEEQGIIGPSQGSKAREVLI